MSHADGQTNRVILPWLNSHADRARYFSGYHAASGSAVVLHDRGDAALAWSVQTRLRSGFPRSGPLATGGGRAAPSGLWQKWIDKKNRIKVNLAQELEIDTDWTYLPVCTGSGKRWGAVPL